MKTAEQPRAGTPEQTRTRAAKGLTGKHIVLILGTVAIVCAAVVLIVLLTRQPADIAPTNVSYVVDESNFERIGGEIKEKVAAGMFETHMNTTWTFLTHA